MVSFRKITEENFDAILRMDAGDSGLFTTSAAVSLAQAWLYRDEPNPIYPFAIYDDETPVGFMQIGADPKGRLACLWHFLIDRKHQGKGYGTAAVKLLLKLMGESGKYDIISLCCHKDNLRGQHLYQKLGFRCAGPEGSHDLGFEFHFDQ